MKRVASFLHRKKIFIDFKHYGIDAMGAMALGLFASLLIGTMVQTLAGRLAIPFPESPFVEVLRQIGRFCMQATGPAMAVSIGYALQAPALVLFSLAGVGVAANELGGAGGPLAVLFAAIIACETGKLVSKETKIDILVTPLVTAGTGILFAVWTAPWIGAAARTAGDAIVWATGRQPFLMGMLVALMTGIALTLPISSAAICAALGLTGLAGGAAFAGCAAQMVGFAVIGFRVNGWNGLVSQGFGTSMLQLPNIFRKPAVWLAPCFASLVTGALSTTLFSLEMNGPSIAAGMGTCGLVGPLGVVSGWYTPSEAALAAGAAARTPAVGDWLGLAMIGFVLPAILSLGFSLLLERAGLYRVDDLALRDAEA